MPSSPLASGTAALLSLISSVAAQGAGSGAYIKGGGVPGYAPYQLVDDYPVSNFFDKFSLYSAADPTKGFVRYVTRSEATTSGFVNTTTRGTALMKPDSTNLYYNGGLGRPSVRLESINSYFHGLFILDLVHMPWGCGTWPAYWLLGPNWPATGEIDIIEGINTQNNNTVTVHTSPNCTVAGANQLGVQGGTNCDTASNGNSGCGVVLAGPSAPPNNYGSLLNAIGGGVYATEWTSEYIRTWWFPRGSIPSSITAGAPDVSQFGTPAANHQGACDIDSHFSNMSIIFNIDFCGTYAGSQYVYYPECPQTVGSTGTVSCNNFVGQNPGQFGEAYFEFNRLQVYQMPASIATTSRYSTSLSSFTTGLSSTNTVNMGMGTSLSTTSSSSYTGSTASPSVFPSSARSTPSSSRASTSSAPVPTSYPAGAPSSSAVPPNSYPGGVSSPAASPSSSTIVVPISSSVPVVGTSTSLVVVGQSTSLFLTSSEDSTYVEISVVGGVTFTAVVHISADVPVPAYSTSLIDIGGETASISGQEVSTSLEVVGVSTTEIVTASGSETYTLTSVTGGITLTAVVPAETSSDSASSSSLSAIQTSWEVLPLPSNTPASSSPTAVYSSAAPACPTSTAAVCASSSSTACSSQEGTAYSVKCGVAYVGRVRQVLTTASLPDCQSACNADSSCVGINYSGTTGNCTTFSEITGQTSSTDVVNAVQVPSDAPACPGSAGSTYADANGAQYTLECSENYSDYTIGTPTYEASFTDCLELCDNTAGCAGVQYDSTQNICSLKSTFGPPTYRGSAYIVGRRVTVSTEPSTLSSSAPPSASYPGDVTPTPSLPASYPRGVTPTPSLPGSYPGGASSSPPNYPGGSVSVPASYPGGASSPPGGGSSPPASSSGGSSLPTSYPSGVIPITVTPISSTSCRGTGVITTYAPNPTCPLQSGTGTVTFTTTQTIVGCGPQAVCPWSEG